MGDTKLSFKRYEKKFLLSAEQYHALRERLDLYIEPDEFPSSTVCSVYYDTEDFQLIRHSIEGPVYKEKLRLRSYGVPEREDKIFVELKKKYKGVVYKRRILTEASEARAWLAGEAARPEDSQMAREMDYVLQSHALAPRVYIACDRTAWRAKENPELRITFDQNIRWRQTELDLCAGSQGEALLEPGQVLMEIKIPGAAPLWLARMLSELALFPTSFSKYGTCYKENLLSDFVKGVILRA